MRLGVDWNINHITSRILTSGIYSHSRPKCITMLILTVLCVTSPCCQVFFFPATQASPDSFVISGASGQRVRCGSGGGIGWCLASREEWRSATGEIFSHCSVISHTVNFFNIEVNVKNEALCWIEFEGLLLEKPSNKRIISYSVWALNKALQRRPKHFITPCV